MTESSAAQMGSLEQQNFFSFSLLRAGLETLKPVEVCAKVDATTIDISRGGGGVFGGSPYGEETPIMEVSSFEGRILGSGGENILQNRISKFILSDNEPRANKNINGILHALGNEEEVLVSGKPTKNKGIGIATKRTLFMGERKGPPSPTRDHRMLLNALDERSFEGAYGGNL
ncbi:hypothetical protein JHK82_035023 [Glycine max]|nr:hypothetical protein JHK86_035120 [Glycine max]KAG5111754.1 hypothetical protein JHK82_035023 [Glycine max]